MNTQAYIESGIIESYVLGLASADEAAELEMLCTQYADIKDAVDTFEALMEAQAFENAVAPPPHVKAKLLETLAAEFAEEKNNNVAPVIAMNTINEPVQMYNSGGKWKYVAAASIVFLIASAALNFYYYNSYKSTDSKYQALLTERNTLQANNDAFRTKLNDYEQTFSILENPDLKKINLPGVKGHESSLAIVYWDNKTKDVYLVPSKMDALPSDKQYQLWALVDGKPVNAGLLQDCKGNICSMVRIPNAQGFAITVEPKGGSTSPHLDAMIVYSAI